MYKRQLYGTSVKGFYGWRNEEGMFRVGIELLDGLDAFRQENLIYSSKVKKLASSQEGKSVKEKARFFHDYLINACEYDSSLTHMDAYDCLIGGSAVCNLSLIHILYVLLSGIRRRNVEKGI